MSCPPSFEELSDRGEFDIRRWRRMLDAAAGATAAGCDAICPFGFELFSDRRFLSAPLDRLYVLLRVPDADSADRHGRQFLEHLCESLRRQTPAFFATVSLLRLDSRNIGEPNPNRAGSRMINLRTRRCAESALDDYARYLIAGVDGILSGELGEAAAFDSTSRARRRVFQLFQMLDYLGERCLGLPRLDWHAPGGDLYRDEIKNMTARRGPEAPHAVERRALDEVVLPRLRLLQTALRAAIGDDDRCETFRVADMFTDGWIHATLHPVRARALRDFIVTTYERFPGDEQA